MGHRIVQCKIILITAISNSCTHVKRITRFIKGLWPGPEQRQRIYGGRQTSCEILLLQMKNTGANVSREKGAESQGSALHGEFNRRAD